MRWLRYVLFGFLACALAVPPINAASEWTPPGDTATAGKSAGQSKTEPHRGESSSKGENPSGEKRKPVPYKAANAQPAVQTENGAGKETSTPSTSPAKTPASGKAALGERFETPYNVSASRILSKNLLSGPHHRVEEAVENDGYMNIYTVRSRYGAYRIVSTALLAQRVYEFSAMAAMDKVSGAEEFGKGVWEGGVSVVKGVKNLVTQPVDTLGSAATGVGKLFTRAGEGMTGSRASNYEDSTGAKLTGFASTRREVAVAFGVDPYSTNMPMQEKLKSVAAGSYAGSLTSMGLKALIPGGVGLAVTSLGGVNWLNEVDLAQPPGDLRMKNRELIAAMGVGDDALAAFMDNGEFTPTQQSLLVKALHDLGRVGGRELFIKLAATTENQDQAFFRQRMALMYGGFHKKVEPIKGFTRLGRLVGAVTNSGKLVLCFPLDNLCWTKALAKLGDDAEVAIEKFEPAGVELWITGTASTMAKKAVVARKWTLRERAGKELLGETF